MHVYIYIYIYDEPAHCTYMIHVASTWHLVLLLAAFLFILSLLLHLCTLYTPHVTRTTITSLFSTAKERLGVMALWDTLKEGRSLATLVRESILGHLGEVISSWTIGSLAADAASSLAVYTFSDSLFSHTSACVLATYGCTRPFVLCYDLDVQQCMPL